VWGAIHYSKTYPLKEVTGSLTGDTYLALLQRVFTRSNTSGCLLQHDGARAHIARKVKNWLHEQHIHFCPDWPPNSPDLNPIENLWAFISRLVLQRCPASREDIEKYVYEEWSKVDRNLVRALIKSMPRRIAAVIRAQGGNTHY
jgi:hypothetical protein